MNRELKFRTFCEMCDKFVLADYRHWVGGMEATCPNHAVNTHCYIMQFTGLLDKSGVEIYEGDIITTCTFNYLNKDHTVNRQDSIDHNMQMGVVEWVQYNCSFMVMRRQWKDRLTNQWNNSFEMNPSDERYEVEVIGNIYSNPELLNKTTG